MTGPWMPSTAGAVIDLLAPTPAQVDFEGLAWAMAHLNRYAGHARKPVSVGLHTLIGLDIVPENLRPQWLLHDAHETRTGEHTTPAKQALEAIAIGMFGPKAGEQLRRAREQFEAVHDGVIHRAAGVPMPTPDQAARLRQADLVCLAIERRDFMDPGTRPWSIDAAGVQPCPKARTWKAPDRVADALLKQFHLLLPALKGRVGRITS